MAKTHGAMGHGGGPSQRQLRAGELIRHALVEVLVRDETPDPSLDGRAVTVSEVRMSSDLRIATCFVVPLGGGGEHAMIKQLAAVAPWLSAQVAKKVRMKFAPRLRFLADESFDEAHHIDELLKSSNVARDLGEKIAATGEHDDGA